MSLPAGGAPTADPVRSLSPRSAYLRILMVASVGVVVWFSMPGVPRDQTVIFALGAEARSLRSLDVSWEGAESEHVGGLTLNFPSAAPERVARTLRVPDGQYWFRVQAQRRDGQGERTEVVRRVTLDGSELTLRLEELTE